MGYDAKDPAKEARLRLVTAAFEEAWGIVAVEFHWPNNPTDRKAASTLLARLVDSHVKTGLELAVDIGFKAYEDYMRHHKRGTCSDCG